jgi:16S rRNA (cytidine1402-2'-O)-methyltransferase
LFRWLRRCRPRTSELPREAHKKATTATRAAPFRPQALLAPALAGQDMGLISEAGMPAVADPGSSIVRAAHDLGIASCR